MREIPAVVEGITNFLPPTQRKQRLVGGRRAEGARRTRLTGHNSRRNGTCMLPRKTGSKTRMSDSACPALVQRPGQGLVASCHLRADTQLETRAPMVQGKKGINLACTAESANSDTRTQIIKINCNTLMSTLTFGVLEHICSVKHNNGP